MGVDCMQPNSRKHLRVITVFLGFISVAVAGLWVMGGAESECTVEVTSPLPPMVLSQRFEERFRNLQPIDTATLQADAIRRFESQDVGSLPVSMLCGWGGRGGILMPLADIVIEGNSEDGLLSMDPAVVFTDAEFVQHSAVRIEWFGRDGQFVYLRELDTDNHVRLVRLDHKKLEFGYSDIDSVDQGAIRYTYSITHSGIKRWYGKLFDRSCEMAARNRLEWLCRDLESAAD